jgi:hypothetical protein
VAPTMIVEPTYKGYRIEVYAERFDGAWDADLVVIDFNLEGTAAPLVVRKRLKLLLRIAAPD